MSRYPNWFFSATNNIPCIKILIVQNFQKVVTKSDSPRLSKRCSSITTVLISLMRVTISYLTLKKKDSIQISIFWFFASKSGLSQESYFLFCWLLSIFNLIFLSNHWLNFFQQDITWKFYSCLSGFDWKTIDIDPCIEILMVQNFQKVVIKNDLSRLSKWCFAVTTVLIFSWGSESATLHLEKRIRLKFQSPVFLASKSGIKIFL